MRLAPLSPHLQTVHALVCAVESTVDLDYTDMPAALGADLCLHASSLGDAAGSPDQIQAVRAQIASAVAARQAEGGP